MNVNGLDVVLTPLNANGPGVDEIHANVNGLGIDGTLVNANDPDVDESQTDWTPPYRDFLHY